MLDERQYRDDQPCGDAVAAVPGVQRPAHAARPAQKDVLKSALEQLEARLEADRQRGRRSCRSSTGPNTYFSYDSWHGYPGERREILEHIKSKGIKDVVFLTGDIHTFGAGDVQIAESGESVATRSSAARSPRWPSARATSRSAAASCSTATTRTRTRPGVIDALLGINPWVDYADFDHHGYVVVEARRNELKATLRRISTIKRRSATRLPDVSYTIGAGRTSLKGKRRGG